MIYFQKTIDGKRIGKLQGDGNKRNNNVEINICYIHCVYLANITFRNIRTSAPVDGLRGQRKSDPERDGMTS